MRLEDLEQGVRVRRLIADAFTIEIVTFLDSPLLILWDVDHTLVDAGGISRTIYEDAFSAVLGKPLMSLANMTGRTERAILAETLSMHNVEASVKMINELCVALGVAADKLRDRIRNEGRVLPGARSAVASLVAPGIVQTLVTGNIISVAVIKLESLGLSEGIDFSVGGYGTDGDTRPPLIRCALRRAESKYGFRFKSEHVIVIGDTPLDVTGARDVGVRSVGVASGASTVADLKAAGADAVIADLADLEVLHRAIFGIVSSG